MFNLEQFWPKDSCSRYLSGRHNYNYIKLTSIEKDTRKEEERQWI